MLLRAHVQASRHTILDSMNQNETERYTAPIKLRNWSHQSNKTSQIVGKSIGTSLQKEMCGGELKKKRL